MTRAVCEVCGAFQPPDWRPGDVCVQCGSAVRREKRCHWCARLTPDGGYCRHCGSALVPDDLYGVARMLKAAGVDQLTLPERLLALPGAQREQFARLYAPQEQMAERHAEDLSFAAGFLRVGREERQHWVSGLEDALLSHLPMPEPEWRALALPPRRAVDDLDRLTEIRDGSPFALTSQIAALASVWRGAEGRTEAGAVWAAQALRSPDAALGTEAALALADWRFTALHPYAVQPGELRDALLKVYLRTAPAVTRRADPLHAEAGLGLALLAQHYANVQSVPIPAELLAPLLASEGPDLAFGAALALGETGALRAALHVPERRFVAAQGLARQGEVAALVGALPLLEPYEQSRVLSLIRKPQPALHGTLLALLGQQETRTDAARLLLQEGRPENALPLIEADPSLAGKVLSTLDLSTVETEQVCARLLAKGQFSGGRLSVLRDLAASGRVSDAFVPAQFAAAGEEARLELLSLAGTQLAARADPGLHRFLWALVEGEGKRAEGPLAAARERAWSVLSGWYGAYGHELRLSLQGARQFFGGVGPLVERLCVVAERPQLFSGLFSSYTFLGLLDRPDPDVLPAVREADADGRLRRAFLALARRDDAFAPHRAGAVRLLGLLAALEGTPETEQLELKAALTPFLHPDMPWQVQRAALAALYPDPQAQAERLAEWKARKEEAQTYAERAPLDDLIYQLEQVMSGSDR